MGSPYIVLQLCIFVAIAYGIFLIIHLDDLRTSKEKKRDIKMGIVIVSIGSFLIVSMWIAYFLGYKKVTSSPAPLLSGTSKTTAGQLIPGSRTV